MSIRLRAAGTARYVACAGSEGREASVPDTYCVIRVDDASYLTICLESLVSLQAASIIHSAGERAGVSCELRSS